MLVKRAPVVKENRLEVISMGVVRLMFGGVYVGAVIINEAIEQVKRVSYLLKGMEVTRINDDDNTSFSYYVPLSRQPRTDKVYK